MKKIIATVVLSALAGISCGGESGSDLTTSSNDSLTLGGTTMTTRVSCASQLFQRRECGVDTQGGRIRDARITQDMSNPPFLCNQGNSHGFTDSSVWVNHGCSAEFEVTIDVPVVYGTEQIRCASNDGRYHVCDSSLTNIRRIRLIRQETSRPCDEGQSYGAYQDAVWVDRGCVGVFEVTGQGGPGPRDSVELYDRQGAQGNRYVVTGQLNNLADVGFNDRTESIIVRRGTWELCQHADFNGFCRTFGPGQYDDRDLGPLAGQVSSVRPN
jgi:hypothetical protein